MLVAHKATDQLWELWVRTDSTNPAFIVRNHLLFRTPDMSADSRGLTTADLEEVWIEEELFKESGPSCRSPTSVLGSLMALVAVLQSVPGLQQFLKAASFLSLPVHKRARDHHHRD